MGEMIMRLVLVYLSFAVTVSMFILVLGHQNILGYA